MTSLILESILTAPGSSSSTGPWVRPIHARGAGPGDRLTQGLENCIEIINVTRPEVIQRDPRASILAVGCDAVETNTFGGMRSRAGSRSSGSRDAHARDQRRRPRAIAREQPCDEVRDAGASAALRPRVHGPRHQARHARSSLDYAALRASYGEQALGTRAQASVDAFLHRDMPGPAADARRSLNSAIAGARESEAQKEIPDLRERDHGGHGHDARRDGDGGRDRAARSLSDRPPQPELRDGTARDERARAAPGADVLEALHRRAIPNAGLPQLVDGQAELSAHAQRAGRLADCASSRRMASTSSAVAAERRPSTSPPWSRPIADGRGPKAPQALTPPSGHQHLPRSVVPAFRRARSCSSASAQTPTAAEEVQASTCSRATSRAWCKMGRDQVARGQPPAWTSARPTSDATRWRT